jgi:hypothetical protein
VILPRTGTISTLTKTGPATSQWIFNPGYFNRHDFALSQLFWTLSM